MEDDDLNGLIGDLVRFGTVTSVDLSAGLAVVEAGDVTSPPLPWAELAGNFRTWRPPSVGEQIILICPEGDIEGGVILRGLFSNAFAAPADDENHHIYGADGLTITLTPDGLLITAPSAVSVTGDVIIEGDVTVSGTLTAATDVVGGGISLKSHTHSGVEAGSAETSAPS